jgi:hypothetical protein
MRNAVYFIQDEAVDIEPERILFFHGQERLGAQGISAIWGNWVEMRAAGKRLIPFKRRRTGSTVGGFAASPSLT